METQEQTVLKENMKKCPIDNTFKLIGKKFTIHILRNMVQLEQKRFNEFLASIEGLNPKTLSARLREMEKSDIIKRTVFPGMPVRVEYFMTEKGRALTPILDQMAAYSMKYCSKDVFKDGRPRGYRQVYGKQAQIVK